MGGPPGVLRLVHTESPAIHQLQFRFSYPAQVSIRFLFVGVCSGKLYSLYLSAVSLISRAVPCDFTSLMDLRRVDFSVCSGFLFTIGMEG